MADDFTGADYSELDPQKWAILTDDEPNPSAGMYILNNRLHFAPTGTGTVDAIFESRNSLVGDFDIRLKYANYNAPSNPSLTVYYPRFMVYNASAGTFVAEVRKYETNTGSERVAGQGTTLGFGSQNYTSNGSTSQPYLRLTRTNGNEIKTWAWWIFGSKWGDARTSVTDATPDTVSYYSGPVKVRIQLRGGGTQPISVDLDDFTLQAGVGGQDCYGSFSSSSTSSSSSSSSTAP